MADDANTSTGKGGENNPFLTKDDLIAHLKGAMFPAGKQFAPSLVMWGDPHGEDEDIDHLEHLQPPEDDVEKGRGSAAGGESEAEG